MINSYLLEVIKALQPLERQEISLLLASPNQGSTNLEMGRLYQIVLDAMPDCDEKALNKNTVFFEIFSEQEMVPGKLEKLMTDLNKFIRTHALNQQYFLESNSDRQQIDWAMWLRLRGLSERSKQVVTKLKSRKSLDKVESLEQYRTLLLIAEEEHEWECLHNQVKGELNISKVIYFLDLFYHNYRTDMENSYLIQQKSAQLPDFEWPPVASDFYERKNILLQISRAINDLLKSEPPSVEKFKGLMKLLNQKEASLSDQMLSRFYIYLRNACTLLINDGYLEFTALLHQIHKDNLGRGFFFVQGEISPHAYINLVQIAMRVKDIEWAKEFTILYQKRIIGGDEGQFFYQFNMAHCLFAEGRFDDALSNIPDAPSSSHYHRTIRRLELKIYYELRSDLLHFKIFAFRKFVERTAPKTIASKLRTMDMNFLNLLLQLAQSPIKDKIRSAKLIGRIEKKSLLSDRAWLLEKAMELG